MTSGTTTTGGTAPPTTSVATTTTSESTGVPTEPGVSFRLSKLEFIDPHMFLSEGGTGGTGTTGDPAVMCNDGTPALNTLLNQDIGNGGFNLVIYFAELAPGAEMRLFEGDCTDPGDGTPWTCTKKQGTPQTIFETSQIEAPPCRDLDVAVFQAVNVAGLNDPPPPCVRTEKLDFSVAISNAAGALNLREAQIVASPDDVAAPTRIPSGVLYGFLPKASAEDIDLEVALFGTLNLWDVIDSAECAGQFPEQVPSVDMFDLGGGPIPGVWLGINFEADRVVYVP